MWPRFKHRAEVCTCCSSVKLQVLQILLFFFLNTVLLNSIWQCCSAGRGGAFRIAIGSRATVSNFSSSTFAGNVAKNAEGGVFLLFGGFHTIKNNVFVGNSAASQGGVISFWTMCGGKTENSTFFGE